MICYSIIGLKGGIDLNKSRNSKECIVYYYQYFNHGFEIEKSVCNGCHDLLMIGPDVNNIVTLYYHYNNIR